MNQSRFTYNDHLLVGDGISYFIARNHKPEKDTRLKNCPLLRETFPLDRLLAVIKNTAITHKQVILCMGQYELNDVNVENKYASSLMKQIIEQINSYGVERIMLLFPLIKPPKNSRSDVSIGKVHAFRRIFHKLRFKGVHFVKEPAMTFAKTQEYHESFGSPTRYAVDKNKSVIADCSKFYWSNQFRRYFPDRSAYKSVTSVINNAIRWTRIQVDQTVPWRQSEAAMNEQNNSHQRCPITTYHRYPDILESREFCGSNIQNRYEGGRYRRG